MTSFSFLVVAWSMGKIGLCVFQHGIVHLGVPAFPESAWKHACRWGSFQLGHVSIYIALRVCILIFQFS